MSPRPKSLSAPGVSITTRESIIEDTLNAIRAGTFALMSPVTTSTLGLWVANTK